MPAGNIKAVTFDFFETMIHSRRWEPRGKLYHAYLAAQNLRAEPWEHQVLYDVFEYYYDAYRITLTEEEKLAFWAEFCRHLFERTHVQGHHTSNYEVHADTIRDIFGPKHFELYPEVHNVLRALTDQGYRLAVISNWQKGLTPFCHELGIVDYFETILSSAELEVEKPDPRIFREAAHRLQLTPAEIVHIGDQPEDDIKGADSVGFHTILISRNGDTSPPDGTRAVRDLREVCGILDSIT